MSVGFRKSLFGFHCDDVLNYIKQSQQTFAEKTEGLTAQVEALSGQLSQSNDACQKLHAEKAALEEKLQDFQAKYEEVQRLSENIGKLYLVAQTNAQAIMNNSEKNAELAKEEVERHLNAVTHAQNSLGDLKQSVLSTSREFVDEIDALLQSLEETRTQITENQSDTEGQKLEFEAAFETITK